jgi:hypothetical protein
MTGSESLVGGAAGFGKAWSRAASAKTQPKRARRVLRNWVGSFAAVEAAAHGFVEVKNECS